MKNLTCKINFKHIKYFIYLLLVIIWMVTVFMLSAQVSTESENTSNGIVDIVIRLIYNESTVSQEKIDNISFIVRKLAHFSLYTIGGFLIANYMRLNNLKKYLMYSSLIGILYAITDEIHQLFVVGRSCELRDVIIDSCGIIIGIVLFYVLNKCMIKIKGEIELENEVKEKKIYLKFKRVIDFVISLLGLIILSPVFLILVIWVKLDSKGPILFKQKRVGKNKKMFHILKFRTMRIDTPKDTPTHMLKNADMYITRAGKFLRKTSLDELPQLLNILVGEMSIIGPRPALYNQEDLISKRDIYGANNILPGLTGLAQISGRDELEINEKARLDGEYVTKMSLRFDIKIFFMTIVSVLKHDGVVEGAQK